MTQRPEKEQVISAALILGILYFSFMILDRVLSVIYGFNFQPFGPYMPTGFTIWGHLFDASLQAVGLYLVFRLYDFGEVRNRKSLQVLALVIYLAIGAVIPYLNDSAYIASRGMGSTVPVYIVLVDLYFFSWGLLTFRLVRPIKNRAILLGAAFTIFLVIHFVIYAPMFPEFYWS
jgi:hypothetical protein